MPPHSLFDFFFHSFTLFFFLCFTAEEGKSGSNLIHPYPVGNPRKKKYKGELTAKKKNTKENE